MLSEKSILYPYEEALEEAEWMTTFVKGRAQRGRLIERDDYADAETSLVWLKAICLQEEDLLLLFKLNNQLIDSTLVDTRGVISRIESKLKK